MAVTAYVEASKTSLSTTEWSLVNNSSTIATDTTAAVIQVLLDLSNLAAGDVFRFRVYEKVKSASTQRVVFSAFFSGVQGNPNFASPSLMLLNGWDATLIKISGTDRTIDWSIRSV